MLPSQSARSSSSRSHMYRRTKRKRWPLIVGLVTVLLGAGVVFKWWGGAGEKSPAETTDAAKNDAAVTKSPAANPARSMLASSASTMTNPPVEKISMGSSTLPSPSNPPAPKTSNPPPVTAPAKTTTTPPAPIKLADKPADKPATTPPPAVSPAVVTAPSSASSADPGQQRPGANTLTNQPAPTQSTGTVAQRVQAGLNLLSQNKPVEARSMLTLALESPGIAPADATRIREELTRLNQRMIFGPEIVPGDPHVMTYHIQSGDALSKLPRKLGLKIDWRFIQRINNISAPERIQAGQRLKIVKGPFHAIIDKATFNMDLYLGDGSERVYVRSFKVGLGEFGATPEGAFTVKPNSKLVNPAWTNPRTGEQFDANDPKNPLGEFWIGLIGSSENIRDLETYGIHGTIEPETIGQFRSMGCVRMLDDDIALIYEVLTESTSRVEIHGEDYP